MKLNDRTTGDTTGFITKTGGIAREQGDRSTGGIERESI
jgi:hypothetical protein